MASLLGTLNPNPPVQDSPELHRHGERRDGNGDDGTSKLASPESTSISGSSAELEKVQTSHELEKVHSAHSHEVRKLARKLTEQSLRHAAAQSNHPPLPSLDNPFLDTRDDSPLNPHSEHFSPRQWLKLNLAIRSRDPDRYPARTAGVAFRRLGVHGFGAPTDYQKDVANVLLSVGALARWALGTGKQRLQILRDFAGVVRSGEMLMVLGRPGSGCSTFLKTIAGETHGLYVDDGSYLNYQGISPEQMHHDFRGEAIYMAETEVHFPQMTVGQTLKFAARARAPANRFPGVSADAYAEHMKDMIMASFGLRHTEHTKVGNDFIRGVSGGERKRVSIAEASLSGSPLQCWDNSTRGLDSANALEFCRTLRLSTELDGATACLAIYQASQSIYDVFDKVTVLYEGRQIYFGPTAEAKAYFVGLGFECPERQTTADFLTSLTSPVERVVRKGFEDAAPRTPDEFVARWKESADYARLMNAVDAFDLEYPVGGKALQRFVTSRKAQQARQQRVRSPYTLSIWGQIGICMARGFQRLRGDMTLMLTGTIGNFAMALIIGSVFYNLLDDSSSFYGRGALLFFAVLLNAFSSNLEILTLYAQRAIVEKHTRYALYHPFAEAIASMLCDLPAKCLNAITFNLALYFLTNLRRTPAAFFTFLVFTFSITLAMSMIFRTIGASSRTLAQALAPAAIILLALMIYTGFTLPLGSMGVWFRWINYIDPIAYAFESLMVNEFRDRRFPCAAYVPQGPPGSPYAGVPPASQICAAVGAVAGQNYIDGDRYLALSFNYYSANLWRNLGIIYAFTVFFCATYLVATEYISAAKSKGEVLLFRRRHMNQARALIDVESRGADAAKQTEKRDEGLTREASVAAIQKQEAVFHWKDVCFDIKVKGGERRLLDHVDGWVRPGVMTALMGESGAGKTTLLDVLASRTTIGVVSGAMLVDGRPRDSSFQRKTGYVQQQDLHLQTATVRESLQFSALLRQPANVSRRAKLEYVEEVIKLLEMQHYADAVVGVPGEGLNVEQRKRLTIGVEMAAKPQLLLFLDEPTSGLDSQTSWSICDLMEKLARHGQAILFTIHQPSAMLFQRFDRLLFLTKGGRTVYFGEIGPQSRTMTNYFEKNGAPPCPPEANPAEWMLEVIGSAPGSHTNVDWPQVWRDSPEITTVHRQLDELAEELPRLRPVRTGQLAADKASYREFAAPFAAQLYECLRRVFSQYWRTPSYIYSKTALSVLTALFIGFSFYRAPTSLQGLQNQMFSIFMLFTIFSNLVQQIMPNFVVQRALYEARERPSKSYSWQAFLMANIMVELPWNTLMAVFIYVCWYYPIGLYNNAVPAGQTTEREALMFLLVWVFLMFTSTFAHMVIAGADLAETGGNIANLLFSLCLIFCG